MYACRACGGNLKFDVESQMLKCSYCEELYAPDSVHKDTDGEEDSFDITVFHCPQCGGEIYSVEETAAGFCSYCGASTILQSRLDKGKSVEYIIPFKKTKEECKDIYLKKMKYAIYAPSKLKKRKYIDEFRGIYMPYWMYDEAQIGEAQIKGTKTHRQGDYIYTDHYQIDIDMNMDYSGLNYDGSSAFSDDMSEKIAPYDLDEKTEFAPGYLCGFYADMADVDGEVYRKKVKDFANSETFKYFKNHNVLGQYKFDENSFSKHFPTKKSKIHSAMFPVWFLSYQNKGRVAYATINGQNGKIASDVPIDINKYFIGTFLLLIPFMLILNAYLTLIPTAIAKIALIVSPLIGWLYSNEISQIVAKETAVTDLGLLYKRTKRIITGNSLLERSMPDKKKLGIKDKIILIGCLTPIIIILIILFNDFLKDFFNGYWGGILVAVFAIIMNGSMAVRSMKYSQMAPCVMFDYTAFILVIASVLGGFVFAMKPVSDYWYYGTAIVMFFAMALLMTDFMKYYNVLATRRLVLFDHKGGDDCA